MDTIPELSQERTPRKRTRGVSPNTKQRRERGRAAQAAFRKRQINTIEQQQEQLAAFRDAFKTVDLAYARLKLAVKMSTALGSGEIPSNITNDILGQLEQALSQVPESTSTKASPPTKVLEPIDASRSDNAEPSQYNSASKSPHLEESSVHTQSEYVQPLNERSPIARPDAKPDLCMVPAKSYDVLGPWLTVGSLPRPITVNLPPIELVPYMSYAEHSSRTFAGKLFWTTMSFAYQLLSKMHWNAPGASKMFQYYRDHFPQDVVKRRIATKLIFNGTGVGDEEELPEMTRCVNGVVVKQMTERGEQIQSYLDPREVELYFRRRWIDPNNLSLVGVSDAYSILSVDEPTNLLLKELRKGAVCFGDTIRYHVDDIERAYMMVAGNFQMLPDHNSSSTTAPYNYVSAH